MKELTRKEVQHLYEIGKLKIGEIYKYKDLCEIFNEEVFSGGNSKKSQIKKWETFCEFVHPYNKKTKKESIQKYEFLGLRDVSIEKYQAYNGRKSEEKELFDRFIFSKIVDNSSEEIEINGEKKNVIIFSFRDLINYKVGLSSILRGITDDFKIYEMSKNEREYLKNIVRERYTYYVRRSLESLKKRENLKFTECLTDKTHSKIYLKEEYPEKFADFERYQNRALREIRVDSLQEVAVKNLWFELFKAKKKLMENDGLSEDADLLKRMCLIGDYDIIFNENDNVEVRKFLRMKVTESVKKRLKLYKEKLDTLQLDNDIEEVDISSYDKSLLKKREVYKERWLDACSHSKDGRELLALGVYEKVEDFWTMDNEANFRLGLQYKMFNLRGNLDELEKIYIKIIERNL